jgi:hypothetical protein
MVDKSSVMALLDSLVSKLENPNVPDAKKQSIRAQYESVLNKRGELLGDDLSRYSSKLLSESGPRVERLTNGKPGMKSSGKFLEAGTPSDKGTRKPMLFEPHEKDPSDYVVCEACNGTGKVPRDAESHSTPGESQVIEAMPSAGSRIRVRQ